MNAVARPFDDVTDLLVGEMRIDGLKERRETGYVRARRRGTIEERHIAAVLVAADFVLVIAKVLRAVVLVVSGLSLFIGGPAQDSLRHAVELGAVAAGPVLIVGVRVSVELSVVGSVRRSDGDHFV